MWALVGIGILVAGFAARLNPLLIVVAAALATGLAAGHEPLRVVAELGKAFNDNRLISIAWLVLPVIGLLERGGLQEQARRLIGRFRGATTGRLLLSYFAFRQGMGALGLTAVGGQAPMVRPLIAPMAEAAAERRFGSLPVALSQSIRAHAAAVDNIAVFFGEDIFIAFGSVLLIKGVLDGAGYPIAPLQLSVWAIPTALAALAIHGARLMWLDRRLRRTMASDAGAADPPT